MLLRIAFIFLFYQLKFKRSQVDLCYASEEDGLLHHCVFSLDFQFLQIKIKHIFFVLEKNAAPPAAGWDKVWSIKCKNVFIPKSQFKKSQHVCFFFHKKATLSLSLSINAKCSGLENTTAYLPHYCIKYSTFSSRTSWLFMKAEVHLYSAAAQAVVLLSGSSSFLLQALGATRCSIQLWGIPYIQQLVARMQSHISRTAATKVKEDKKVKLGAANLDHLSRLVKKLILS